jgi:hypothetical protein
MSLFEAAVISAEGGSGMMAFPVIHVSSRSDLQESKKQTEKDRPCYGGGGHEGGVG